PSARSRHPACLEELLQRLAAEGGHHLGVGHALGARELLEAEEARAVVLHRLPVQAPHHPLFLLRECLHRLLWILEEQPALVLLRQGVQEAVEAQSLRAALEIENVTHLRKTWSVPVFGVIRRAP